MGAARTSTSLLSPSPRGAPPRTAARRRGGRSKVGRCAAVVVKPMDVDRHARACSAVYEHYVLNSTCTFEEEPPDLAPRLREVVDGGLPAFVAVEEAGGYGEEEEVVGYAYCSRWSPRSSYRFTLSPSCYVHKKHHRKGVGRALMTRLAECSRERGFRQVRMRLPSDAVRGDAAVAHRHAPARSPRPPRARQRQLRPGRR